MSGKQMEGDNQRRRSLARRARDRGQAPSAAGATLGSGKQPAHADRTRRAGPPPDGGRSRPAAERPGPAGPPPGERPWPLPDAPAGEPSTGAGAIGYRDLVTTVGRRTGTDFDQARAAAAATVIALARALDDQSRERLVAAVPAELRDGLTEDTRRAAPRGLAGFVGEVAQLCGHPPEQARYQAQATLTALAEQDQDLVDSLAVPTALRELLEPDEPGGGLVGAAGGAAPLTDAELRSALADLPYWSGDRTALSRTIELPPDGLDRVLRRIAQLRPETGRGPRVGRQPDGSATVLVSTARLNAVTGLDVALAHQVDAAIDEAGAGMAGT